LERARERQVEYGKIYRVLRRQVEPPISPIYSIEREREREDLQIDVTTTVAKSAKENAKIKKLQGSRLPSTFSSYIIPLNPVTEREKYINHLSPTLPPP
jgi:hypothetical protein